MAWEHGSLHAQQYAQCMWCKNYIWRANFEDHMQNHYRNFVETGSKEAEAKVDTLVSQLPAQDSNQEPDSTTE